LFAEKKQLFFISDIGRSSDVNYEWRSARRAD